MPELTDIATETTGSYSLRQAVLVYERRSSGGVALSAPALVTVHPVKEVEGRPEIGPGVEATDSFLRRLHTALSPKLARAEGLFHFFDERLLGYCSRAMLWHLPSQRRTMKFHTSGKVQKLSGREFLHPHLVFFLHAGALRIFALRHPTARPSLDTELCLAPYYNLASDGDLCWGSAKHPTGTTPNCIADWEDAFFTSRFTHLGYPTKFVNHRGGHLGLWAAMAKPGARRFPGSALVSTGMTLRELLHGRKSSLPR